MRVSDIHLVLYEIYITTKYIYSNSLSNHNTNQDNFAKGKYPTLNERAVFIQEAIEYVNNEIQTAQQNTKHNKLIVIVSFSFVNTDLRTAFRESFPDSVWILVDTSDDLAKERISKREGHFYKNTDNVKEAEEDTMANAAKDKDDDNSEWNFQPVTFPHMILDGRQDVEVNARQITECIEKHI